MLVIDRVAQFMQTSVLCSPRRCWCRLDGDGVGVLQADDHTVSSRPGVSADDDPLIRQVLSSQLPHCVDRRSQAGLSLGLGSDVNPGGHVPRRGVVDTVRDRSPALTPLGVSGDGILPPVQVILIFPASSGLSAEVLPHFIYRQVLLCSLGLGLGRGLACLTLQHSLSVRGVDLAARAGCRHALLCLYCVGLRLQHSSPRLDSLRRCGDT